MATRLTRIELPSRGAQARPSPGRPPHAAATGQRWRPAWGLQCSICGTAPSSTALELHLLGSGDCRRSAHSGGRRRVSSSGRAGHSVDVCGRRRPAGQPPATPCFCQRPGGAGRGGAQLKGPGVVPSNSVAARAASSLVRQGAACVRSPAARRTHAAADRARAASSCIIYTRRQPPMTVVPRTPPPLPHALRACSKMISAERLCFVSLAPRGRAGQAYRLPRHALPRRPCST